MPTSSRRPIVNKRDAVDLFSDQAARFDGGPRSDTAMLEQARNRAARALDDLAGSATDCGPGAAGHHVPARHQARAPDDPGLGVTAVDHTDAAGLAQRQRHFREGLPQGRYRDDDSRLIELYFREIAADANAGAARP